MTLKTWSKHQVVEDAIEKSATFSKVIDAIAEYFDMEVLATRLNFY